MGGGVSEERAKWQAKCLTVAPSGWDGGGLKWRALVWPNPASGMLEMIGHDKEPTVAGT